MSKRFPIPEFDRDQFKNLEWTPPAFLSKEDQDRLIAAQKAGDAQVCGGYPIQADDAFYDHFSIRGEHRHAILCVLPDRPVTVVGRSFAWYKQRALMVDSLDPTRATVLHDWRTPRPMNTRLGPENGVTLPGGILYVVCAHRYADHWIGNRTLIDNEWTNAPGGHGFRILSSSDDRMNDFHHCNLSFSWAG